MGDGVLGTVAEGQCDVTKVTFQIPIDTNPVAAGELFKLLTLNFFIFCEGATVKERNEGPDGTTSFLPIAVQRGMAAWQCSHQECVQEEGKTKAAQADT